MKIKDILIQANAARSVSQVRRFLHQDAVKQEDRVIKDENEEIDLTEGKVTVGKKLVITKVDYT